MPPKAIVAIPARCLVRTLLALLAEIARILAAGGQLLLTVPNASGFGRLDVMNLYRYFSDITHLGDELPELSETGWRRHYTPAELEEMVNLAGFRQVHLRSGGMVGNEIRTARALVRRVLLSDRSAPLFEPASQRQARCASSDRWLRGRGSALTVTAIRR